MELLFVWVPFEIPLFIRASERKVVRGFKTAGITVKAAGAVTALGRVDRLYSTAHRPAPVAGGLLERLRPVLVLSVNGPLAKAGAPVWMSADLDAWDDSRLTHELEGSVAFAGLDSGQKMRILRGLGRRNENVAVLADSPEDLSLMEHANASIAFEGNQDEAFKGVPDFFMPGDVPELPFRAIGEARNHLERVRAGVSFLGVFRGLLKGVALLPLFSGLPLLLKPASLALF
ncbi:MAG: hypothetical protein EBX52_07980, partial [Proteobacteria bacterium]|nr:hypothetical protein [Pseudomonadota bacterium]